MTAFFNPDMDRRLSDLQAALEAGDQIDVAFLPPFSGAAPLSPQPARVQISFGERVIVFDRIFAAQLADQLQANGFEEFAQRVRPKGAGAAA